MESVGLLFPVASSAPLRVRSVLIAIAAMAVATWLQVIRLGGDVAVNTIWGEDGNIFLGGAINGGRLHEILVPYAGYVLVVPRLIAVAAASLPLSWAAAIFAISGAAVVALLAGFIYRASSGHIGSLRVRLALAMIVVLIPAVGFEVQDNITNLHWFFDAAAVWALLWRPQMAWERLLATAVIFLAAATDPLVGVLLPLAVLRLVAVRRWQDSGPVAGLVAGLAVQLLAIFPLAPLKETPSILDLAKTLDAHIFIPFVFGGTLGERLFAAFGYALGALVVVAIVVSLAWLLRRAELRPEGWAALIFVAAGALFAVVSVYRRWGPVFIPVPNHLIGIPARYWVVPLILLWSAAAVVVGSSRVQVMLGSQRSRVMIDAFCVWLIVLAAADFGLHNTFRDAGPAWDQQLAGAKAACQGAAQTTMVTLNVPPNADNTFRIPCARLTG